MHLALLERLLDDVCTAIKQIWIYFQRILAQAPVKATELVLLSKIPKLLTVSTSASNLCSGSILRSKSLILSLEINGASGSIAGGATDSIVATLHVKYVITLEQFTNLLLLLLLLLLRPR